MTLDEQSQNVPAAIPVPHWAGQPFQVVVIGGGNAALVAAMQARHFVERVLLVECAPRHMRGGNTRHTRNVRCVHASADAYNTGSYLYDELWNDLCNVGSGPSNEELASYTVRESESVPPWMTAHDISWQTPLRGTLHLGRTNRFFLGGGTALINTYYRTAEKMGITVGYDTRAVDLLIEGDRCSAVVVEHAGRLHQIRADAIVCASGGFEANLEWLREYWGDAVDNYFIRGPEYNDGTVLRKLYEHGADKAGEERGFHAVAVDARSPRYDGGIATRLDSIPYGIVVNDAEERFYDEGEDLWPKRYAMWGGKIALEHNQIAYCIWDVKSNRLFLPPMYGTTKADDIAGLAVQLGIDPSRLSSTVDTYNAAVVDGGTFDPSLLDDCHTEGLHPPKTHWARRIDTPPYFGIAMRPGITFTYMGVAVRKDSRVVRVDGSCFSNVFAAGEIMSGNILSTGYLAGFGLTIGTVWGRIAGSGAAHAAG